MVTITIGNETVSIVSLTGALYEAPRSCFDAVSIKDAKDAARWIQDGYPELVAYYNETASFLDSDSRRVFARIYAASLTVCSGCTVHPF